MDIPSGDLTWQWNMTHSKMIHDVLPIKDGDLLVRYINIPEGKLSCASRQ